MFERRFWKYVIPIHCGHYIFYVRWTCSMIKMHITYKFEDNILNFFVHKLTISLYKLVQITAIYFQHQRKLNCFRLMQHILSESPLDSLLYMTTLALLFDITNTCEFIGLLYRWYLLVRNNLNICILLLIIGTDILINV